MVTVEVTCTTALSPLSLLPTVLPQHTDATPTGPSTNSIQRAYEKSPNNVQPFTPSAGVMSSQLQTSTTSLASQKSSLFSRWSSVSSLGHSPAQHTPNDSMSSSTLIATGNTPFTHALDQLREEDVSNEQFLGHIYFTYVRIHIHVEFYNDPSNHKVLFTGRET